MATIKLSESSVEKRHCIVFYCSYCSLCGYAIRHLNSCFSSGGQCPSLGGVCVGNVSAHVFHFEAEVLNKTGSPAFSKNQ